MHQGFGVQSARFAQSLFILGMEPCTERAQRACIIGVSRKRISDELFITAMSLMVAVIPDLYRSVFVRYHDIQMVQCRVQTIGFFPVLKTKDIGFQPVDIEFQPVLVFEEPVWQTSLFLVPEPIAKTYQQIDVASCGIDVALRLLDAFYKLLDKSLVGWTECIEA
ncbi:hypothetical protein BER93_17060 [Xanthomonas fragariae]|nr:hypothetical protein BER92_17005 [Xanthomonas fragariae]AOD19503.1 hypothetical protein BER93_17060 [Xanthomonas fragariae]ENZ96884.1 hypothetical protein O1K_01574 [Xanthomonas fragariae LMG 25863]ENZ96886.1 hypothetical protein O1K_01584 [Xanthomonas fragariae LMG 25863]